MFFAECISVHEETPASSLTLFWGSSACSDDAQWTTGENLSRTPQPQFGSRVATAIKHKLYPFLKSSCAQHPPMDSSSIVDVHSGVTSIIHEFRQASELLQKWRKGGAGKKAVGQEECEVSFDTGKSTIEETLNRFSRQCGARFDRGDSRDRATPTVHTLTLNREMPGYLNRHSKEVSRGCR